MEGDAPEEAHGREQPRGRHDHRHERHDLADACSTPAGRCRPVRSREMLCPIFVLLPSGENSVDHNRYSPPGEYGSVKIAVIGGGVSGLGAAYVLARLHDVEVFERDERAGGHTRTIRRGGLALDTGFLVHNARNYPLLDAVIRGARRCDPVVGDVVLGLLPLRARVLGPATLCAEPARGRPALPRAARRDRTLAADREGARSWSSTTRTSLRRYLDERGFSTRFRQHFLVPLTAALWSTAPGRAWSTPRRRRSGSSTITACSASGAPTGATSPAVATRTCGARRAARPASAPRQRCPLAAARARRHRVADRRRRAAHVRRRGRRDARGPGAQAARGSVARRVAAARCVRVHAERGDAAHGRAVPAARRGRARFVELPARGRGKPTMTYYLNRLQSLESDVDWCLTLNGDVAGRACRRPRRLRASTLYRRQPRRAARAAVARGRPADVVRRRPPRQRIPRGRSRFGRSRGRSIGVDW